MLDEVTSNQLPDVTFAGLSDVGLCRSANQDSYYLSPTGDLFIVADGMGGHVGGQEASRLATEAIRQYMMAYAESSIPTPELLEKSILAANAAVLADQRQHLDRADMGTTVVMVMFREGQFWVAHVGDSRLYCLRKRGGESGRDSGFIQLTQDHTWVAQAQQAGSLSADEIQHHPWRHVLSQCVGREDLLTVKSQLLDIEAGDRLLLCSDGLTEELSDDEIVACLQSAATCESAVASLIAAAKAQGGRDNITAITLALAESAV